MAAERANLERDEEHERELLETRNEIADENSDLVQRYNTAIESYNKNFAMTEEELGVCERVNGRVAGITVYAFENSDDLTITLAHELGHAIGLEHVKGDGSLMSAVKSTKHPTSLRLTEADKAELQQALAKL